MNHNKTFNDSDNLPGDIFSGGGEMGARIKEIDWIKTSLGPISQWPNSLKTIVRLMLTCRQPVWIGWGKELIKLYNDPYIAIVGGKHPWALGKPSSVVWEDIWYDIGPMLQKVTGQNEGIYIESHLFIMERNGYPEEAYYTFSYSPVYDDDGSIGGIYCTNTEETSRIIGERQLTMLKEIAARTLNDKTFNETYTHTQEGLAINNKDLPFTLLYLFDEVQQVFELVVSSGMAEGHSAAPKVVKSPNEIPWPLHEAMETGEIVIIDNVDKLFDDLPKGFWDKPANKAVGVPISQPGKAGKAGVLIVGLNPLRILDANYQGFLKLVASQIAASLANVQALEVERKRAEALAAIDKAKTIFFSNVSHEFRTPLTLMLGPLEELLNYKASLDNSSLELVKTVHRNSLRLLKLVNTLLDFSRIEAGSTQASFQLTDICTLTADLSSAFRSAIEKAGIKFSIHCGKITDPVYVDATMWERIVFNLLSNAFKFTFDGEISVSVSQVEDKVELKVTDSGTGIPQSELSKLFSRFHRIENSKGRTHEGSGIGLAMVGELVKLHGGNANAKSVVGKGSEFTITIPVGKNHLNSNHISDGKVARRITLNALTDVDEELVNYDDPLHEINSIETSAILEPIEANALKERILIADDNKDMRQYITNLLIDAYEVVAVKDGVEALSYITQRQPALILSDIMMPNMDGLELIKKLRADEKTNTIPVIFLSARAGEESKLEGIQAGADDYLIKPFNARELMARVKTNLSMAKMRYQSEEKIRESEERFRSLADQSPMIVYIVEPDTSATMSYFNKAWLDYTGQSFSEAIGRAWNGIVHPDDLQQIFDIYIPAFQNRQSYTLSAVRLRRHDGEYRYHLFKGNPRYYNQGEFVGYVGVGIDIHEQKTAQLQLETSNHQLKRINSDLDSFIYTASHDLKAPVSNIEGLINTLIDSLKDGGKDIDEEKLSIIELINMSIQRFKDTILDLTEIGKIQKNFSEDVDVINIKQILEDVKILMAGIIEENEAVIIENFESCESIKFSRANFKSILLNLISNAIKYRSEDRKPIVELSCHVNSHRFQLEIKDNGLGIPDFQQEKIFSMFKRAHNHVEGSGVGLYLVKRIVDNVNGRIQVQSEVGKGSKFTIEFDILD